MISYLGQSCFKLQDKLGPEGVTLVTDPFNKELGLKVPNFEADIVTVSHQHFDHNYLAGIKGEYICFDSPGEYEIKTAEIRGIPGCHDDKDGTERGENTIFTYEIDGINLCHLGDQGKDVTLHCTLQICSRLPCNCTLPMCYK